MWGEIMSEKWCIWCTDGQHQRDDYDQCGCWCHTVAKGEWHYDDETKNTFRDGRMDGKADWIWPEINEVEHVEEYIVRVKSYYVRSSPTEFVLSREERNTFGDPDLTTWRIE